MQLVNCYVYLTLGHGSNHKASKIYQNYDMM